MPALIGRLRVALRYCYPVRRWGPRCSAPGPWRLADCAPCTVYRGHNHDTRLPSPEWHADGQGYIWNATRWQWMGPLVSLAELMPDCTCGHSPEAHHLAMPEAHHGCGTCDCTNYTDPTATAAFTEWTAQ